jgi:hypothetical protein
LDYFGPVAPPLEEAPSNTVTIDILNAYLATAPPLSSPHRDGRRNEHFVDLAKDPAFAASLARVLNAVVQGAVP